MPLKFIKWIFITLISAIILLLVIIQSTKFVKTQLYKIDGENAVEDVVSLDIRGTKQWLFIRGEEKNRGINRTLTLN
jgi:hypothetical protein